MKKLLGFIIVATLASCGVKDTTEGKGTLDSTSVDNIDTTKYDTIFTTTISDVKISTVSGIDSIVVEDL